MHEPFDVVVIGAGAAGLLAAARSAERGRRTLLLEKNPRPGVKILMSGGTRCNITHATDRRGIVEAFGEQGRFLHSALAALGPNELVAMFNAEGVATKVEPGGKIFPVSNRAADVLAALVRMLQRSGAELRLNSPVTDVVRDEDGFTISMPRSPVPAAKVILAVGGQSYPGSGTTGDGYAWAKALGHRIVPPRPALTPLVSPARWVAELRGVTVPDVEVRIVAEGSPPTPAPVKRPKAKGGGARSIEASSVRRGSFLFTHFGLSGPVVMDHSHIVTKRPHIGRWQAVCDFLPSIPATELAARLSPQGAGGGKKLMLSLLAEWLPKRLAESLLALAQIPPDRRTAELTRGERAALVEALKGTRVPVTGSLGFKKAEVTAGGVALDEVDSRTMESKRTPGLYLAGEILDLDGPIGGYNFQAAFSTGWLAGSSV